MSEAARKIIRNGPKGLNQPEDAPLHEVAQNLADKQAEMEEISADAYTHGQKFLINLLKGATLQKEPDQEVLKIMRVRGRTEEFTPFKYHVSLQKSALEEVPTQFREAVQNLLEQSLANLFTQYCEHKKLIIMDDSIIPSAVQLRNIPEPHFRVSFPPDFWDAEKSVKLQNHFENFVAQMSKGKDLPFLDSQHR